MKFGKNGGWTKPKQKECCADGLPKLVWSFTNKQRFRKDVAATMPFYSEKEFSDRLNSRANRLERQLKQARTAEDVAALEKEIRTLRSIAKAEIKAYGDGVWDYPNADSQ